MGGQRFQNRVKGMSMSEAYRDACRLAEAEHGHCQGYSGEINSTGGFHDITKEWKESKLDINSFVDKKEDKGKLLKGEAYGVCIREPHPNKNKIKSQVKHNVEPGTKKWKLVYTISTLSEDFSKTHPTKTAAVKFAREYTEKTGKATFVNMEKVLSNGSKRVATITYKKSDKESEGEYYFFGVAPC